MIRVLVSCANGAGSSLLMKMSVDKALKKLGYQYSIYIIVQSLKARVLQQSLMWCFVH